ncbi:class F sortase [Streptomyces sp. enrichment culture]|uniref:class F sortase n=1 Tax=Streptomyces sp. enrichment culture TaxID=1795815 RepID=UPI003F566D83
MARRSRRHRPWYRTRAYRLTRTLVLVSCLLTGGVWWAGDDEATDVGPTAAAPTLRPAPAQGRAERPRPSAPAARTHPPRPSAAPSGKAKRPRPAPPARARPKRPPAPKPPAPLGRSPAVRVTIDHIGVKAPVIPLGLDREGRLTAPPVDDPRSVGWWKDGPAPGGPGTAVAVGHLDTRDGPAVFAGLRELGPGRVVRVRRADGWTAVYTIDKVRTYAKDRFPSDEVYRPRRRPELRLITCAGTYSPRSGYDSNVVAFAHLTATQPPPPPSRAPQRTGAPPAKPSARR